MKANLCFGEINLLKLVGHMGNFPSAGDNPTASVLLSVSNHIFFPRTLLLQFLSYFFAISSHFQPDLL